MKEYKVDETYVMMAESRMNSMARDGWKVVAVTPLVDSHVKSQVMITYEREKQSIY